MAFTRFLDKVVLVTGSGRGIGQAIAVRLAQEGAKIIVNDLHEEAEETLAKIKDVGGQAVYIQADLSKMSDLQMLLKRGVEAFGHLDVLVNNAGIEHRAPFGEVTEEQYDRVMDVNLKSVFFLSQAFANYVKDTKRAGNIINISSVHEELPFPNFTAYCASKGGLQMVMRNLSVELAAFNIRVNNVAPGAIKTPINTTLLQKPELIASLQNNISLGRLGEPEDVASVVAFLACDDSKYVTGSTYYVDGGLTFHYTEQ